MVDPRDEKAEALAVTILRPVFTGMDAINEAAEILQSSLPGVLQAVEDVVATKNADLLQHVATLIERTADLDYDPSQSDGSWVCGGHGIPECRQGDCASLPWPEPNFDRVLGAFQEWADREFLRVVRPYDEGRVAEMPEEAFRSYSVSEWPIGDLLDALSEYLPPVGDRS